MKEKITMTISIGCAALILTMVMFTQFKTVDKTDITAIETMRETELRTELANWKTKYEEVETKMQEQEARINEYKQELDNDENTSKILEQEVKEAENYLGYKELKGEGIIVTLSDSETHNIEPEHLLRLINELNSAGAEAISVNDERIVSASEIAIINYSIIRINERPVSGPYVVRAIGDKKYLESALTIKNGFIDEIKNDYRNAEIVVDDNVVIPAYNKELKFEYAKDNKEEVKK